MPPFHNFTTKAKEAVRKAHELAIERGQNHVSPVHLLTALVMQEEGIHSRKIGGAIDLFVSPESFFAFDKDGNLAASPSLEQT